MHYFFGKMSPSYPLFKLLKFSSGKLSASIYCIMMTRQNETNVPKSHHQNTNQIFETLLYRAWVEGNCVPCNIISFYNKMKTISSLKRTLFFIFNWHDTDHHNITNYHYINFIKYKTMDIIWKQQWYYTYTHTLLRIIRTEPKLGWMDIHDRYKINMKILTSN